MDPLTWTAYIIIIIILTALDSWFIHRRIENEHDRWMIFIIIILGADTIIAFMQHNSWQTWGIMTIGFIVALIVNRFIQNLILQREKNRELINKLTEEIENRLAQWRAG